MFGPLGRLKLKVTLHFIFLIVLLDEYSVVVFKFHIDLTLTAAMVTETGHQYRLK